jgi:tRNA G18 (ribose-2'-O)-methylase SpoU
MGETLRIPWRTATAWPDELAELRRLGFVVVVLTPSDTAVSLHSLDLAGRPVVLVLGAEGPGVGASVIDAADLSVRIPQRPYVDSLNVAAAAAIALYQLALAEDPFWNTTRNSRMP